MARTGFRVDGVAALRARLARLPTTVKSGVNNAVGDSADAVKADAQSGAPVDTGRMRDAIDVRTHPERLAADVGIFDAEVDYWPFPEFGTSRMPAQPFLTPAAEAERQRLAGRVAASVRAKLR